MKHFTRSQLVKFISQINVLLKKNKLTSNHINMTVISKYMISTIRCQIMTKKDYVNQPHSSLVKDHYLSIVHLIM
ncbi:hypothetical protein HanRHA438_Chr10g0460371 [Helianthus annuus]|nr:hypothetical protein HanHA300_Chr10g0368131 [Helianthus annuus]KAJ0522449.1 hypothetical protein HanIR_Chr10g0482771 [Helianthus annuus]KAJ0880189.1 hypothetical protein HanRHA438_Chr10g0460371 [Helianthus annuus]